MTQDLYLYIDAGAMPVIRPVATPSIALDAARAFAAEPGEQPAAIPERSSDPDIESVRSELAHLALVSPCLRDGSDGLLDGPLPEIDDEDWVPAWGPDDDGPDLDLDLADLCDDNGFDDVTCSLRSRPTCG